MVGTWPCRGFEGDITAGIRLVNTGGILFVLHVRQFTVGGRRLMLALAAAIGRTHHQVPDPFLVVTYMTNSLKPYLDSYGQPAPGIRLRENILKAVEHLLGLCRGVMADGEINDREIAVLATWMANNQNLLVEHPVGRVLVARVARVLDDGVVTDDERSDLQSALEQILGGGVLDDAGAGGLSSTAGQSSNDGPVLFEGRRFVVTGKFLYGPRRIVEEEIQRRGGELLTAVSPRTHVVVVGTMGSRDWTNTSFGTKLEKVYALQEAGHPIRIVAEPTWVEALRL